MSIFKKQKWELVEEGKVMIAVDVLWDTKRPVVCDVYRKQGKDGVYKYKYVKRY